MLAGNTLPLSYLRHCRGRLRESKRRAGNHRGDPVWRRPREHARHDDDRWLRQERRAAGQREVQVRPQRSQRLDAQQTVLKQTHESAPFGRKPRFGVWRRFLARRVLVVLWGELPGGRGRDGCCCCC